MPTRAATPTVAAVLRACVAGTRIVVHHPSRSPEAHALFTALKQRGWLGYFNDDRLDLDPGSTPLQTLTWTIPGDEFEAAACIAALAATRSAGTIDGVTTRNLTVLRIMLERAGARVEFKGDQVKVHRAWNAPRAGWEGLTASAGPEPRDLPSDQLALLFAITPGVHGRHLLTDQSASAHTGRIISPLKAFGAPIEAGHEPGQTILTGPFKFAAPRQPLKAPDAVSQATLLIAALAAQGTTVLASIGHLHHAHPALLGNLRELHADIEGGA
jgi:UDP-N-acetylglucosamine 1-carboxyvinyltransferase